MELLYDDGKITSEFRRDNVSDSQDEPRHRDLPTTFCGASDSTWVEATFPPGKSTNRYDTVLAQPPTHALVAVPASVSWVQIPDGWLVWRGVESRTRSRVLFTACVGSMSTGGLESLLVHGSWDKHD